MNMEKNTTFIKVGGSIIDELSDKISKNHVAMSELIKNAYHADAKEINIVFDTSQNRITISDDGNGMNLEQIEKLLHIAYSNKNYGQKRENGRIIQGAKGLGSLSAFKFGDKVEWETTLSNGETRRFFWIKPN